jgi:two-component system, OmpR family, sensor kinase
VLVLAIVALEVPLALQLGKRVDSEVRSQATSQADVVAATAAEPLVRSRQRVLTGIVRTASLGVRGRVVIVDRRGRLIADSAGSGALGSDYSTRPEIASALRGKGVQDTRRSQTLNEEILATAAPVVRGGSIEGAVRVTQSIAAVHRAVRRNIVGLGLIGLFVLAVGLGAGAVIAGQFARPVRRLDEAARRIASGDLAVRAPLEGSSEQLSLSHSFNEMTDRLSRAIRAQQSFVADASHQLRTPLTGLRLRLEEARAAGVSADAERELEAGEHEVERLARMIDELLVLSRAGEHDAPGEVVDLGQAAADAVHRWTTIAAERGTSLGLGDGAGEARIWASRADVDRALDALVENAVLYSPPGSTVTLSWGRGSIAVEDEGPGLDADDQEKVFERFHRGRAGSAGAEGTGLGLPIARELARRWGGDAKIRNRDGRGARAALEFPDFTNPSPEGR